VYLIEFINNFTWGENKIRALSRKYSYQFPKGCDSGLITWLINGDAVVKTKLKVTYGSDYKLNIIISQGIGKYSMLKPMKIDPKRSVLLLSMLILLMYAISLRIPPSFKLNIHNQCLNVDLVSPTYDTHCDLECYRAPSHKVYARDIMRSRFAIESHEWLYSVLIYKLQRRQLHEATEVGKDTSSDVHILIIWEFSKSGELYADVLLVEYDKGFNWGKYKLEALYRRNNNRLKRYLVPVIETWLLNDNTAFMTAFEVINEDRLLNITISEAERYNYVRTPVYIDLQR
jgi:hypothetical protein